MPQVKDNSELEVKAKRLDDIVEAHEKRLVEYKRILTAKEISKNVYFDKVAESRRTCTEEILSTHEEDCVTGAGYYENLAYSSLFQGLNMRNGLERAKKRLMLDINKLHNLHGEEVVHLDEDVDDAWESILAIRNLKAFLVGMGLADEAEQVIPQLLIEAFCKSPPADGPVLMDALTNISRQIQTGMDRIDRKVTIASTPTKSTAVTRKSKK